MTTTPHCLVVGVGPGLGMGCVRRFAASGYRVSMVARHAGRLESWAAEIPESAGFPVDVADEGAFVRRSTTCRRATDSRKSSYTMRRGDAWTYTDISMETLASIFARIPLAS